MSESPVLPLPPNYTWGLVVARSIRAIADTDQDADRFPEARGSTGRVTFTPLVRFKKHLNTPTAFVHHEVVQARLVDGVLVDAEGHEGVYLIAGVYQVSFAIDSGSIPSFPVEVLPEHTLENPLDLVTASPYVSEPGSSTLLLEVPSGHVQGYVLSWGIDGLGWYDPEIVTPDPGAYLRETEIDGVFEQSLDTIEEFIIANRPVGDLTPAHPQESVSGTYIIDSSLMPSTLNLTLTGDLIIQVPALSATISGTITLIITQDSVGGHAITTPGIMASWGAPIEIHDEPGTTTMIHLLWTGYDWVVLSGAYNIGAL